jgi:hypothetical protein
MRLTGWCGQQPGVRLSREDSKDSGIDIPCEARNQGLTLRGGMGRLQLTWYVAELTHASQSLPDCESAKGLTLASRPFSFLLPSSLLHSLFLPELSRLSPDRSQALLQVTSRKLLTIIARYFHYATKNLKEFSLYYGL